MAGFESESRLVKLGEMGLDTNGEVPRQTISKIYENSFLLPLTTLVMPAGVNHSDWDRRHNQKAREIVDKKIRLLTEIIPAAWYDGNLALHNFTSPRLQAKINDPGNMDHGASHLNRYGNNFRALLPYTTDVVNLPVNDLRDFVIAGEMGVLHDHAEIDALREESSLDNIKEVHAHLGAVNAAGVVRAMRLQGVAIDERVEKLVFYAIYNHSYPLRDGLNKEGEVSIQGVLERYPDAFRHFPLLEETERLLKQSGGSLEKIDVSLKEKQDIFMARLLLRDVYSADKRDSMVPPFLAILRTLFTDQNRPFCESDIKLHMAKLEKFLAPGYKPNERDFTTDLDRIMFEFIRDYRAEGMSGFAVEWLGASMTRKWEYAVMITESLASRDFSLVNRKFDEYANSLWDEYFREAVGISESVVKMKGEKLLVALFGLERQRHSAIELMQKKSAIKVIPAGNLSQLYDKIVTANRLPLLRQHAPFPDDLLHVFEVDDLPI